MASNGRVNRRENLRQRSSLLKSPGWVSGSESFLDTSRDKYKRGSLANVLENSRSPFYSPPHTRRSTMFRSLLQAVDHLDDHHTGRGDAESHSSMSTSVAASAISLRAPSVAATGRKKTAVGGAAKAAAVKKTAKSQKIEAAKPAAAPKYVKKAGTTKFKQPASPKPVVKDNRRSRRSSLGFAATLNAAEISSSSSSSEEDDVPEQPTRLSKKPVVSAAAAKKGKAAPKATAANKKVTASKKESEEEAVEPPTRLNKKPAVVAATKRDKKAASRRKSLAHKTDLEDAKLIALAQEMARVDSRLRQKRRLLDHHSGGSTIEQDAVASAKKLRVHATRLEEDKALKGTPYSPSRIHGKREFSPVPLLNSEDEVGSDDGSAEGAAAANDTSNTSVTSEGANGKCAIL